ncbi:hypothetical protein GCM10027055_08960 [Janibacter alkaliphilus]|uniref:Beta-amylase n=1 Tax=Janibacter alkaliphilus TaxID=1069963 RepID=A0A852WYW3_9MICO|nr:family 14 glycosylhydrolase [Janibacter alkaliphilus]NYG36036.1 hypothetical protein [Janibacter alkaliphilus]
MTRRRCRTLIAALGVAALGLTAAPALAADEASSGADGRPGDRPGRHDDITANVMAPLKVTDWADFRSDLQTVEAYGVQAVSVDVWWGDVEPRDNRFEWGYYDRVFEEITDAGLDVAPILSFHQCGGNVGDDYTSLLPGWLWTKYADRRVGGQRLGQDGLKHRSEQGNYSAETVQGWADRVVANEYRDLTRAFAKRYGREYDDEFVEINVSLGPSGELRYPAYNQHDEGTGYPTRGALQSYSRLAVEDFRREVRRQYGSLHRVNRAWGTRHRSWSQVRPPQDADAFFADGDYTDTRYGRDFVDWYNGSLVEHGERMLRTVSRALGGSFRDADIGYKVPGIHWNMTHPVYPRATEVTTGLIQTSLPLDSARGGHGYDRVVELAHQVRGRREVVMHFTALEMGDNPGPEGYSLAKTLVGWIGDHAEREGVSLKGENALAGGVRYDFGWDQIEDAFADHGYDGLTVLRMADVAEGTGARRYAQFIDEHA